MLKNIFTKDNNRSSPLIVISRVGNAVEYRPARHFVKTIIMMLYGKLWRERERGTSETRILNVKYLLCR